MAATGQGKGAIADLLVAPGRDDAVRALAAAAVAALRRAGAGVIRCWLPRIHPYRAALVDAGFAPDGPVATHHFRAMQLDARAMALLRDASTPIHLMLGDSDTV